MDLTSLTHVLYALVGVGFLIFVHELGHFLAAKKVGIRVDTFSIGFQPTIFGFRARFFAIKRGETEYVLGMVPFGGYVKMAGEELGDQKTGSADEYASKSVGARALVLVAGATMNLIFGFLFFILAFTGGVRFQSPIVAGVDAGGPAWTAGLRPGDRIVALNGEPKGDMEEVLTTIALGGLTDPVRVGIERVEGDQTVHLEMEVTPTKDPRRGMPTIGIHHGMASRRVDTVRKDSPAAIAGLRPDDEVVRFALYDPSGQDLGLSPKLPYWRQWPVVLSFNQWSEGCTVGVTVDREGTETEIRIPLEKSTVETVQVGLTPQVRTVASLQPGSPANDVFKVGQEIATLNGQVVQYLDQKTVLEAARGQTRLTFTTTTGEQGEVDRDQFLLWLSGEVAISSSSRRVSKVEPGGVAEGLGIAVGHELIRIGARPVLGPSSIAKTTTDQPELTWWDGTRYQSKKLTAAKGDALELGIELDAVPTLGRVVKGKPAELAGIQPGDRLIRVNGEAVKSFRDLSAVVNPPRAFYQFWVGPPEEVELTVARGPEELTFQVPTSSHPVQAGFALAPQEITIQAPVGEAFVLGMRRGHEWMMRIFHTMRALVLREVDAKNLAGPIGIVDISRRVVEFGLGKFIFFLGLISINLGIFNLLPFPILDGGHLLFLLIEKIKGSPVSDRIQNWAFTVAFVLLIGLALFVTFHDLRRLL